MARKKYTPSGKGEWKYLLLCCGCVGVFIAVIVVMNAIGNAGDEVFPIKEMNAMNVPPGMIPPVAIGPTPQPSAAVVDPCFANLPIEIPVCHPVETHLADIKACANQSVFDAAREAAAGPGGGTVWSTAWPNHTVFFTDAGYIQLDRSLSLPTVGINTLSVYSVNISAPTSAGSIEIAVTHQSMKGSVYLLVGPSFARPSIRVEYRGCTSEGAGGGGMSEPLIVSVAATEPPELFWFGEMTPADGENVRFQIPGSFFDKSWDLIDEEAANNSTWLRDPANVTLAEKRSLRVWMVPSDRHTNVGYVDFEVELFDAGLDALLAFSLIGFVMALCFPCCSYGIVFGLSRCFCAKACKPSMLRGLMRGGAKKGGCLGKCVSASSSIATCSASLASVVTGLAALLGVAFNITVFNKAISWAEPELPSLTQLASSFVAEFGLDVSPLLNFFERVLEWLPSLTVGGIAQCEGLQTIVSTIQMLVVMWIVVFIVFADIPAMIVVSLGSGGVASEMLASGLAKLTIFLLQVALLSQYDVGLRLGEDAVKAATNPCTLFDEKIAELFVNLRTVAFVLSLMLTLLAFLVPKSGDGSGLSGGKGTASACGACFHVFFSGVLHSGLVSAGVWLPWSLAHYNIAERADKFGDLEDAGQGLISIQAKVQSLVFLLMPPPVAVVTKLAEATNDPPLFVFTKKPGAYGLDPLPSRILGFVLSVALFVFELIAATTAAPWALAAAGGVVVLSFLLELVTALVRVVHRARRVAARLREKLAERAKQNADADGKGKKTKKKKKPDDSELVFANHRSRKRSMRGKGKNGDGGDGDGEDGQSSRFGTGLGSAAAQLSNAAHHAQDSKKMKQARERHRRIAAHHS